MHTLRAPMVPAQHQGPFDLSEMQAGEVEPETRARCTGGAKVKCIIESGSRPEIIGSVRKAIAKLDSKNPRARRKGIRRLIRRAWDCGLPTAERWAIGQEVRK